MKKKYVILLVAFLAVCLCGTFFSIDNSNQYVFAYKLTEVQNQVLYSSIPSPKPYAAYGKDVDYFIGTDINGDTYFQSSTAKGFTMQYTTPVVANGFSMTIKVEDAGSNVADGAMFMFALGSNLHHYSLSSAATGLMLRRAKGGTKLFVTLIDKFNRETATIMDSAPDRTYLPDYGEFFTVELRAEAVGMMWYINGKQLHPSTDVALEIGQTVDKFSSGKAYLGLNNEFAMDIRMTVADRVTDGSLGNTSTKNLQSKSPRPATLLGNISEDFFWGKDGNGHDYFDSVSSSGGYSVALATSAKLAGFGATYQFKRVAQKNNAEIKLILTKSHLTNYETDEYVSINLLETSNARGLYATISTSQGNEQTVFSESRPLTFDWKYDLLDVEVFLVDGQYKLYLNGNQILLNNSIVDSVLKGFGKESAEGYFNLYNIRGATRAICFDFTIDGTRKFRRTAIDLIAPLADISLAYGADANLPQKIGVKFDDDTSSDIPVTWTGFREGIDNFITNRYTVRANFPDDVAIGDGLAKRLYFQIIVDYENEFTHYSDGGFVDQFWKIVPGCNQSDFVYERQNGMETFMSAILSNLTQFTPVEAVAKQIDGYKLTFSAASFGNESTIELFFSSGLGNPYYNTLGLGITLIKKNESTATLRAFLGKGYVTALCNGKEDVPFDWTGETNSVLSFSVENGAMNILFGKEGEELFPLLTTTDTADSIYKNNAFSSGNGNFTVANQVGYNKVIFHKIEYVRYVSSFIPPKNVIVDYRTTSEQLLEILTDTIVLELSDGESEIGKVTYDLSTFNSTQIGRQEITAKIICSALFLSDNTFIVSVTVRSEKRYISVFTKQADIEISVGEALRLPETLSVTLDDGTIKTVPVLWNGVCNRLKAGEYILQANCVDYFFAKDIPLENLSIKVTVRNNKKGGCKGNSNAVMFLLALSLLAYVSSTIKK